MSRVGESSDDQRIREMQETEYRNRADAEKRSNQERTTKSFQEVMSTRTSREQAQRLEQQRSSQEAGAKQLREGKDAPGQLLQRGAVANPEARPGQALAKHAAMSQAMQGTLSKVRSNLTENARAAETERNSEIVMKSDDERERIGKDVDRERITEAQKADDAAQRPLEAKIDPDADRSHKDRDRRGKGEQSDGKPKTEGVTAAEGPRAPHAVKIPQELIEKIANAVQVAMAADGRTELVISLKGTMLDGVTLKVTARKGKVNCTFEGCDKQLGNLIESSKGELMRQLGKRGLELEILRIK